MVVFRSFLVGSLLLAAACQSKSPPSRSVPGSSRAAASATRAPGSTTPSSPARRASVEAAGFGVVESVVHLMTELGSNPKRLYGTDGKGNEVPLAGVTVEVSADRSRGIVRSARRRVPPGYIVFVNDQKFVGGRRDVIAVMKAPDMFTVIEAVGTNGWNYDISPAAVIQRVRAWHERYGLILTGAGFDWMEADFVRQPAEMRAFAAEVYKFCPDVVDQGTETVDALANEMHRTNSVYLWWD
jgi:hypothetical protein